MLILFLYTVAGLMVSLSLFLRVQNTLNRASGRPAYSKYWSLLLRFVGLALLCALILVYKDDHLFWGLGCFFGAAFFNIALISLIS